jgi:hypothetical protein
MTEQDTSALRRHCD